MSDELINELKKKSLAVWVGEPNKILDFIIPPEVLKRKKVMVVIVDYEDL